MNDFHKFRVHRHLARAGLRQRGMTLVVGLILLMLLTALCTIGFRNTTLSTRITGNVMDRNLAFQSSESAGKNAISEIEAGQFNPLIKVGHFASPLAQGGTTTYWTQGSGAVVSDPLVNCPTSAAASQSFSWNSCAASVSYTSVNSTANVATNAQYVIELISTTVTAPTVADPVGSTQRIYRITTRSTGGSGSADVVLQTMYSQQTTP